MCAVFCIFLGSVLYIGYDRAFAVTKVLFWGWAVAAAIAWAVCLYSSAPHLKGHPVALPRRDVVSVCTDMSLQSCWLHLCGGPEELSRLDLELDPEEDKLEML